MRVIARMIFRKTVYFTKKTRPYISQKFAISNDSKKWGIFRITFVANFETRMCSYMGFSCHLYPFGYRKWQEKGKGHKGG